MNNTEVTRVEIPDESTKTQAIEETVVSVLTEEEISHMERAPLLRHLEAAQNCLLSLTGLYNEYEGLKAEVAAITEKRSAISLGNFKKLLICYALCICAVFLTLILSTPMGGQAYHFSNTLLGLAITAVCVLYTVRVKRTNGTKAEREAKALAYYNEAFAPVGQRVQQIEEEVKTLTESAEYKNSLMLIPPDYLDAASVSDLIRILQNRRADGIKEALNVYENDLHQRRMEYAANRGADAQERAAAAQARAANAAEAQAVYAKQISKNTQSAARSAKELNAFVKRMR